MQIETRIPTCDAAADVTRQVMEDALSACGSSAQVYRPSSAIYLPIYLSFAMLLMTIIYHYCTTLSDTILPADWRT